jgi:hypothetical protein
MIEVGIANLPSPEIRQVIATLASVLLRTLIRWTVGVVVMGPSRIDLPLVFQA